MSSDLSDKQLMFDAASTCWLAGSGQTIPAISKLTFLFGSGGVGDTMADVVAFWVTKKQNRVQIVFRPAKHGST